MTNVDEKRNAIKDSLKTLFRNHAGKDHLLIDQLFFLNAKDTEDKDLAALRETMIDVAFEHPSWGEPMPTKFVPLELQLAKQASEGKKILSITELEILNAKNEGMSLQPKELVTFLKVQHALGKLIYFDEDNLRDYVVTDPAYLIDVLRSIVTEKLFWPKEKVIREKLKKLSTTGIIKKSAILLLWQQTDFKHILPFSEFMIKMLVRLDIMLEPETDSRYFIVPSMITDRPFKDTFKRKKCIYLTYQFTEKIIPPALLYRFLGSFIVLRNLNTDIKQLHLFTDSAVVAIDSKHQVQAYVAENRIILALMHEQSKSDIKPSIASTVQECLTRSIVGTTDFYCAIANISHQKSMQFPFTIQFGVPCNDGLCFEEHNKIPAEKGQLWRCRQHKIQHSVNQMSLWFADKEPIQDEEKCAEGCTGLETSWMLLCPEARHLMRLGALLTHEQSRNLFLNLGLKKTKWENLETKFDKQDPEVMHFYALWHWRESAESPTFRLLLDALQKNEVNACVLCKVVRDIKFEGFSVDMMAWIPDDTTLEELSHHIGNATLQLGIELGLTVTDLENIERNHKDLIEQTRKVLKKWKERSSLGENERPVIKLAKSLKRIGKYRLISNLNDNFETRQHRKICVVM